MSEVSLEAESGKTSAKDPQVDYVEDDKAEESLSEDVKQESVDNSSGGDEQDEELYDIDIDSQEECAEDSDRDAEEEEKRDEGVQIESKVTGREGDAAHVSDSVESREREAKIEGEKDEVLYDIDIGSPEECAEDSDAEKEEKHEVQIKSKVMDAAHMSDSVESGGQETNRQVERAETPEESGESHTGTKESTMAEEPHRSSAAEISVTSNGDLDQSPETVFQRDSYPSPPGALNLPESCVTSTNFSSTTEGIIESGPYRDGGALVLSDDLKSPAMEKLDLVRKWSINTYKCTRQILSEKLGRGSRTVDMELEAQIEVLRDNKRKYQHVIKLAQTLASQLSQMMQTQRQLGDAFADLSLKSPELHEEFGYNADTQKLLSKNGETLLGAINFFISSVNTLVDKTIEDTMLNIKQYEFARVEYDAYRTDLEELNLGPRDATTMPKIEQSQQQFQIHREKYERMRNDVSIKLKFLEENKVKVLHNQLILFHNAIAAYYAGNQQQLEQTLKQFHIKLKMPGGDSPSWLEEH
ncbi:arfaptin-1 isoform X2 [Cheilinus undulatus]|uniref:arfaptin-1 isoform X2 n=1 Tax=Cheilinus undulatus TaxID=241271 RepID=UPI001BD50DC1|nr:arfaptin-1 isoform X2 [Cheilinus undulatus]